MKVTIELDTSIPEHMAVLASYLDYKPSMTEPVAEAVPAPQSPPPPASLPPAPAPAPTPSPTPVTDLREQLNALFAELYQKDVQLASDTAATLRKKYGPDNSVWTEQQLKEALTTFEMTLQTS